MLDKIQETTGALNKSQRLAAIGELSVMIAHDLRNPLQGITTATDFLSRETPSSPEKRTRMLNVIREDVAYCEKMVNDLLDYSRDVRIVPSVTDVRSLLATSLSHVHVPQNVQITDLTQKEPAIKVDVEKTLRVFDNILRNAIEAMPEGGHLMIKSEASSSTMRISFADTGKGIAKEDLYKLFVPLFTTKAKGMGFGLAICKRITDAHKGTISVESCLGKGTTFTIELPL
jgi:signal transduction histidine kinase